MKLINHMQITWNRSIYFQLLRTILLMQAHEDAFVLNWPNAFYLFKIFFLHKFRLVIIYTDSPYYFQMML